MLNFDWLADFSTATAKYIFLGLFLFIGVLVSLIPKKYIFEGLKEEEVHWWKNLKLWAYLVLALTFYIYWIF
jgi:hypothetical protein